MANISQTIKITNPTLHMAEKELKIAFTTIFIEMLWVINRRGRRVRRSRRTLKEETSASCTVSSTREIITIEKSRMFQDSLKYV